MYMYKLAHMHAHVYTFVHVHHLQLYMLYTAGRTNATEYVCRKNTTGESTATIRCKVLRVGVSQSFCRHFGDGVSISEVEIGLVGVRCTAVVPARVVFQNVTI